MKNYREMADDVFRRAEEERRAIHRRRKIAMLTGVPVLCAAVMLASSFWRQASQPRLPEQEQPTSQGAVVMADPKTETSQPQQQSEPGPNKTPEPIQQLHIPAIELPEPEDGVEMDMIGVIVYKGGIYTQAADYFDEDAEGMRGLLGEYLGHASGTIDEWSTQDEYAVELASNYVGDVYTVQGYSPDFRICVTAQIQDADGSPMLWVGFADRLNGIDISTGADLYSDRLHLDGRITGLRYQRYEDWNQGHSNYALLDHVAGLDMFLKALNEGQFQYVYDEDPGFYRDTRAQAFLYLDLDDGTTVTLRLIEGGWVGLQEMAWYFIQLPAEVFDPVFAAVGG